MGIVYEVKDRLTGDRLALKTILPVHLSNPRAVERFTREINTARQLRHPNIVAVYDVGRDGSLLFFTMEFLEGANLRALMREGGRFELEEAVAILRPLCDALEYAHQFMVHRDLSPENIMVLPDGSVKLLDFGLARVAGRSTMTATGVPLGKAHYMSPEQRKGAARVDARTDIYALGVILFEMLTGKLPLGYRKAGDILPELPPQCDILIGRCLVPARRRVATVRAFRQALEQCLTAVAEVKMPKVPGPVPLAPEHMGLLDEIHERSASIAASAHVRPSVSKHKLVVIATSLTFWGALLVGVIFAARAVAPPLFGERQQAKHNEVRPGERGIKPDKFQGHWVGWEGTRPRTTAPTWSASFVGDECEVRGPREWYKGTYSLDLDQDPMQMNVVMHQMDTDGTGLTSVGNMPALGIFRVEQDYVVIAMGTPDSPFRRPTDFGTGRVFTLKRR